MKFVRGVGLWILALLLFLAPGIYAQETGEEPVAETAIVQAISEDSDLPVSTEPETVEPDTDETEAAVEGPIDLGDMYVTAFHGGAVTITPTKTVVDVEKFNKSGSVDRVEDILMHLTGIDVLRGSSGADPQQMVMMRGFDDSRFTIAIDGRTITAPTAGADTYVDWSSLTTGDIEKIEVIRGASSAQFENSQGGIINIITKKIKDEGTRPPTWTIMTGYSDFDTYSARIMEEGSSHGLGYVFNYGYNESDGYLRNNDYTSKDYSGRLYYTLPSEGNISLSVKGSSLDLGYAVVNDPTLLTGENTAHLYDPESEDYVGTTGYDAAYPAVPMDSDTLRRYRDISFPGEDDYDNYKTKRSRHIDLGFQQPLEKALVNFQLYQTTGQEDSYYTVLSMVDHDDDPDTDKVYRLVQKYSGGDAREEKHVGGRLNCQLDLWDNNSMLVGIDHRRMEVHSTPDVWRLNAAYFEDTWQLTPRLTALLGLRYARMREITYAYSDEDGNPSDSRYRHKLITRLWLPKSTITYRFNPDTEIFVSVNKDYHVPGC